MSSRKRKKEIRKKLAETEAREGRGRPGDNTGDGASPHFMRAGVPKPGALKHWMRSGGSDLSTPQRMGAVVFILLLFFGAWLALEVVVPG